ncbi:unnamed protein product [Cochlearia groenlandica]
MELEEDKLAISKKYRPPPKTTPQSPSKKPNNRRPTGSSQTFVVGKDSGGKRGSSLSSNKWVRDKDTYCEFHGVKGHDTKDCYRLKTILMEKWSTGDLANFDLEAVAQAKRSKHSAVEASDAPAKGIEVDDRSEGTPNKRIDMIMGGSKLFSSSVNSIKKHQRKVGKPSPESEELKILVITFEEKETLCLAILHDDALDSRRSKGIRKPRALAT